LNKEDKGIACRSVVGYWTMQLRLLVVLCSILLLVNGLPKKQVKKKVAVEEDEEDVEASSADHSVSSGEGEEPQQSTALEQIGFQQEAVASAAREGTINQLQQAPQQGNATNQNTTYAAFYAQQQQQQSAYNTTQKAYSPAASNISSAPINQQAALPSTNYSVAYASPQSNSSQNSILSTQQQAVYNKNTTAKLANTTVPQPQIPPQDDLKTAEIKCFQKFGNSTKEGQTAPELVDIYKALHDCLKGKCNYKKADKALKKCLPQQETVYHKFKCYYNWYEQIKEVCTPDRKKEDKKEEDNDEEDEKEES